MTLHAAALELRGIEKTFGATRALESVDLTVRPGEVVALLGANGAGKSTLVKIASGVVPPDAGDILVRGHAARFASPRQARESGIVTVHQATERLGVAAMTVAENLVLEDLCAGRFRLLAGPGCIRRRAAHIAAQIELDIELDAYFGELGPAQRQLVAIARAAASQPNLLILDEPTASLSGAESERLFATMERLRGNGVGLLYVSHRMSDIRRIADRVTVLRNGRKVFEQARPFDLALTVRQMIGRDLEAVLDRSAAGAGPAILQMEQVGLVEGSRRFDLNIAAGEIVAITGPLGSGKSRLLGALFGTERLVAGRMILDGKAWVPRGPADAISAGVFLSGEDRWRSSLLPPHTPGADIAGTIALPHRPRWFPGGLVGHTRERAAARRAIAALGIRARGPRDTLDQLSGGNQQKVVVARWQAEPCRLLLLDEPFQGVDVGARRDLVEAIRDASHRSATLIATSDAEEAIEAADRVLVMRDHTIVAGHDLRREDPTAVLGSLAAAPAPHERSA